VELGFRAGLFVHPLNPKAWMMITYSFSNYVAVDAPVWIATAWIAGTLFVIQAICHPIWTFFGDRIAKTIIGTPFERYLMWGLAGFTVAFVLFALLRGEL
jgi:threonine/homoserine/homoserine lactone efflux protein